MEPDLFHLVHPALPGGEMTFPRIQRYRFICVAETLVALPPYAGSTWRGLVAGTTKRAFCSTRTLDCNACAQWASCTYHRLFELPPSASPCPRAADRTHPIVLQLPCSTPRSLQPGDTFELGAVFIGAADALASSLAFAVLKGGEVGLGKGHGRYRLRAVLREQELAGGDWIDATTAHTPAFPTSAATELVIPRLDNRLIVQLLTPLRLQRRKEMVGPDQLTAGVFLHNLVRRMSVLERDFGGDRHSEYWQTLKRAISDQPLANADLRWWDWERWSSRQGARMKLGGLVGSFPLDLDAAPGLWPWLWLCQWTHLGKGTVFGLGRYRLADGDSRPLPD